MPTDAVIASSDGDIIRSAANYGSSASARARRINSGNRPLGRAIIDRETIHIHDHRVQQSNLNSRESKTRQRSQLVVARCWSCHLLRDESAIGAISNSPYRSSAVYGKANRAARRPSPIRPSSPSRTCACSRNSASAMRNCAKRWSIRRRRPRCSASSAARRRTCSRSSTPSSRAPPGFVGSMTWCCDSARATLWFRGLILVPYPLAASKSVLMSHSIAGCASTARSTFPTSARQNDFPMLGVVGGFRTFLAVPLRQQGELIGALNARRNEVRPFTPAQIKLLETFADQAVIAIENVRLFQELKESLEQQTATSEILGVIASSPTDIQPVLDVVAENAARLCDAHDAVIHAVDGDMLRAIAAHSELRSGQPNRIAKTHRSRLWTRSSRSFDRQTIHVHDFQRGRRRISRKPDALQTGYRTMLATPLLREGVPIGVIRHSPQRKCGLSPTSKSRCSKPSPTKPSSPSRTCDCSKNSGAQRGIARSAGASDGDGRGARHHQPLADGRAAGARRHRRERGAGLWDR